MNASTLSPAGTHCCLGIMTELVSLPGKVRWLALGTQGKGLPVPGEKIGHLALGPDTELHPQ